MKHDCVMIGFNDEKMSTIIKRIEPYKDKSAAYEHMLARSAVVNGQRLKYSEIVRESITNSTGMQSDLTIYRMPNMAVHYCMNYLKKHGMSVGYVNYFNDGKEKLKYLIENYSPNCIGVSSTCHVEPAPIREIVDYIRSIDPSIVVVVGGPFINSINFEYSTPQQNYLLQSIGADIFIHERQGEDTLFQICTELRKDKPDLTKIPNIIYKDGHYKRTVKVPENICLDDDPIKEFTFYENHPKPPVYMRCSISCSLCCSFCRYPILGGEPMFMKVESIEKNMNYIHSLGVKSIVFVDDSLNVPLDRFKDMLRMMIRNKYNFKWYSFFRISHSDEETYELMAKSGCGGVILGVESGNDTIRKNMDKRVSTEQLVWGIGQLNKYGIVSHASCMVGFPGETEKTARDTIKFIEEAKPTFYDLQVWFFENAVPISKERDYYNLEGYGYSWSHKDMDYESAGKIVLDGIRNIKNSYFMPSLSFNLWSLAYFLTQGTQINEFMELSKIFKDVVGYKDEEIDDRYRENVNKMLNVFRGNTELVNNLKMRNK